MSTLDVDELLPQHWRRYPDVQLIDLMREFTEDNDVCDAVREAIEDELAGREAMREDPRVAEMMGAPWLEPT